MPGPLETLFSYGSGIFFALYDNLVSIIFLTVLNRHLGEAMDSAEGRISEQYKLAYHAGGIFNHFMLWFSRKMKDTPEGMAEMVLDIFPEGFQPYLLRQGKRSL